MAIGGGGRGAGDIRAGGAWFELWAKDHLTPTLKSVEAKAKSFHAGMVNMGKDFGAAQMTAGVGLLTGALAGLAVAGGKALLDAATGAEKFRKELEKSDKLSAKIVASMVKLHAASDATIGGIGDPAMKTAALEAEIDREARNMAAKVAERNKAEAGLLEGFGWFDAVLNDLSISSELEGRKKKLEELTKDVEVIKDRWIKLQADLTAVGKHRLEGAAGAGADSFLAGALGVGAPLAADAKAARGEVDALWKSLTRARHVFGMTADEATLFDLKAKGATDFELDLIKGSMDRLNVLNTLGGAAGALAGGAMAALPDITSVRGGFNGAALGQQFGIGDNASKQIELLKQLLAGDGGLPDRIGAAVVNGFRLS